MFNGACVQTYKLTQFDTQACSNYICRYTQIPSYKCTCIKALCAQTYIRLHRHAYILVHKCKLIKRHNIDKYTCTHTGTHIHRHRCVYKHNLTHIHMHTDLHSYTHIQLLYINDKLHTPIHRNRYPYSQKQYIQTQIHALDTQILTHTHTELFSICLWS